MIAMNREPIPLLARIGLDQQILGGPRPGGMVA
jgi:hypothetical protein